MNYFDMYIIFLLCILSLQLHASNTAYVNDP